MTVILNPLTGVLSGPGVTESQRTLAGLEGYFRDEPARRALDQSLVVYRVLAFEPLPEGVEGAICCATTFLAAGLVGDEFFLTRGHFHAHQDRSELEVTVSGSGMLVLMDGQRRTWTESMQPGSVHHVPPGVAHRVANVGDAPLIFVSYWPSETGHDYRTIVEHGFSARVRRVDAVAALVHDDAS